MKKRLQIFLLLLFGSWTMLHAQLPAGSIAPDFTATDIDGNTHNLYDLLDAGKTVYLDFSATWCGPCWNYHNTHALRDIWEMYGPDGTDEAYVMFIESDAATETACLYGPTGCTGGTQGNWVAGTPYPIIDDASIQGAYAIGYYPTIYVICPADKKIYETGQLPATGLWNYRASHCTTPTVVTNVNSIQNVKCFGTNTGAINITASGGTPPYTYAWSNGATTQNLSNIPAGTYEVSITSSNGWSGVSDPIEVQGPASPLTLAVTETSPVGCNGNLGSATVAADGGWNANYNYSWSNGQSGETAYSLNAGNYTATVTDDEGCTKTVVVNMPPPVYPTAAVAPPGTLNCTNSTLQLNGTASSTGPDYVYQWFASNGGNILSGATTQTPTVNAAGSYTLQVTNLNTTCAAYSSVVVNADLAAPTAEAGPVAAVTCTNPTTVLQGTGSTGSGFSYAWTAFNGGTITAGQNTLTPTAASPGSYKLVVTNTANGCTKADTTQVTGINTPPTVTATASPITCINSNTVINTTTNASGPIFAWTGPNGYTSSVQNPSVTTAGDYTVTVTDTITACVKVQTVSVSADLSAPGASATGGMLSCTVTTLTLNGATPENPATFAWTGPNGFTSASQNPDVTDAGTYVLTVTAGDNGCTSTATATVTPNNNAPVASATAAGNLNCTNLTLQLDGTGSAQGNDITYSWSTTNGNIVSGGNTQTPLVDAAGTYTILVVNTTSGCTNTATVSVLQSPVVTTAVSSQTNVSCNGQTNGTATVSPSGGSNSYTYNWSNGANTATASNLAAGTYQVVVTDSEGCTAATTVSITEPAILAANASATAQTANGVNDGTASANPVGGTSAYSYLWNNGETTATITGLAPGSYSVVVTDANGCTSSQTVTVNSFNCALAAALASTNVSCFGAADGSATVSLTGANNPVSYTWNNGATTESISNLAAGDYTVNILDGSGCPATLSVSITQPAVLTGNATATSETAAGANDGTATANPVGGTGPYTYIWNNGETTASITGLAPGVYTVVVTDSHNCTSTESVTVNSFSCAIAAAITTTNVSCAGAANGTATVSLTGGTAPFTYVWSNGATTAGINNLTGGTYTVSVTDESGCETVQTTSISEPQVLVLSLGTVSNVVCPNDPSGSATVSATGGTTPYVINWSNGASGETASNLTAGTYTAVVTDGNGCSTNVSATVSSSDTEAPVLSAQNTVLALDINGTVSVSAASLQLTSTDNCGITTVVYSPVSFDCSQLGLHNVVVTATDGSGNTQSLSLEVNVVDNLAPVLTCPVSITACANAANVQYDAPVAVDNCLSNGGNWNLTSGLPSGATFPVGITTQTYTYTDASGNAGSCSFDVEITPPVEIVVVTVVNELNGQNNGAIDVSVAGEGPFTFVWKRNGEVVGNTEDLANIPQGPYTLEVTDANGCVFLSTEVVVHNTTATKEPSWLRSVQLRPNPASDVVNIFFSELTDSEIEITLNDATGRTLISDLSKGQNVVSLQVNSLPEGVYFVKIRSGAAIGIRKLVVGH